MSTNPVYSFEHAPSNTLLRARDSNGIEVFREHELVASFRHHLNEMVGCSADGRVSYIDGYGRSWLIDLGGEFPQEPKEIPRCDLIHPDGRHVATRSNPKYPYQDSSGESHQGIVICDLETGAVVEVWAPDTTSPRPVEPFGAEADVSIPSYRLEPPPSGSILAEAPELVIAGDGVTWALVTTHRLELGCCSEHLASIWWQAMWSFYPKTCTFDLERERVYVAGRPGIVCFGLDGEVLAWWRAGFPENDRRHPKRLNSPIALFGNRLVAVGEYPKDDWQEPTWYQVMDFDPDNLQARGWLVGMPLFSDTDDWFGLLPLADGSLALFPREKRPTILPAEGARRCSTEHILVIGDEPPPRIPHPEDDHEYDREVATTGRIGNLSTATPGQRRALGRFLLEESCADRRFEELLLDDPQVFAPYRDLLATWSDSDLARLAQIDRRHYWRISRGASDETVQTLGRRLEKKLGRAKKRLSDAACTLGLLLVGALTPRALELLGELGRADALVRELCHDHHVAIPARGPAVARFVPDSTAIGQYSLRRDEPAGHVPPLEAGLSPEEWMPDPHMPSCAHPLAHVMTVPLSSIPGDPLAISPLKFQHFFVSNCEECDQAVTAESYVCRRLGDSNRLVSLDTEDEPITCEGTSGESDDAPSRERSRIEYRYELGPYPRGTRGTVAGHLGGIACWWQQPAVPFCPECGLLMFFVGEVYSMQMRDDVPDVGLFGFHCENCGIAEQVMQIT